MTKPRPNKTDRMTADSYTGGTQEVQSRAPVQRVVFAPPHRHPQLQGQ